MGTEETDPRFGRSRRAGPFHDFYCQQPFSMAAFLREVHQMVFYATFYKYFKGSGCASSAKTRQNMRRRYSSGLTHGGQRARVGRPIVAIRERIYRVKERRGAQITRNKQGKLIVACTAQTATIRAFYRLGARSLRDRHTADTSSAKVRVLCLNTSQTAELFVTVLFPLGNELCIGNFLVQTVLIDFL